MKPKEEIWLETIYGNTIDPVMDMPQPVYGSFPSGYYNSRPGFYGFRSLKFMNYRKKLAWDRRKATIWVALLGALFISFCVAVIVFFIVINGSEDEKLEYHVANVSMPLWNTSWDVRMEVVTSQQFGDIAIPFCEEVDSYFEEGQYSSQYIGCSVKSLSQYNTTECQCTGVLGDTWKPVVLVKFDLVFVDEMSNDDIMDAIRVRARAKYARGYRLLFVGDFLIDIISHGVITPSPLEPGVVEGTYVHARYNLYSFNYTAQLQDVTSPRFGEIQISFCENLKRFLEYSVISQNQDDCGILAFREFPPGVEFYLTFAVPRGTYVIHNITWVLENVAPGETRQGLDLVHVGELILILKSADFTLSKINFTEVTATPTSTEPTITTRATTPSTATTGTTTPATTTTRTTTPWTTPETTTTRTTTPDTTRTTTGTTTTRAPRSCSTLPCGNRGYCRDLEFGGFVCQCNAGYIGSRCQTDVNECMVSPCQNSGSCVNSEGSYHCDCGVDWTGQHCAESLGGCVSSPCGDHGNCVSIPGSFFCVCDPGWTGIHCTQDIDQCAGVTCHNNGTCEQAADGTFTCNCQTNWEGPFCSIRVDECSSYPCANGGSCFNGPTSIVCVCMTGWSGPRCMTDINECDTMIEPCYNGGQCVNSVGSYTCTCPWGWDGGYCHINVDECDMGVCANGAACMDTLGSYTCYCTSGWKGKNCSQDINECSLGTMMCMYGGTCVNKDGGYTCDCLAGWTGYVCSDDVDECALMTDTCGDGSTCINTQGSYRCQCPVGVTGEFCRQDINECTQSPCQHGGTCVDVPGSYECTCTAGWTGPDCRQEVNECSSAPCKNGATCVMESGSYRCLCGSGWTGQDCDTDICVTSSPCLNGGSCINQNGSYACVCPTHLTGLHCEITLYACISAPCANGATCLEISSGDYTCICSPGWFGPSNCQQNFDECAVSPCQNGASCVDTQGSFYCTCPAEYTGQICADDVNECLANPCFHGGTCVNTEGSFHCDCPSGWQGSNCTTDVDECAIASSSCFNGAACINTSGSFACDCAVGWTGQDCSTDINECDVQPCGDGGSCTNTAGSFVCDCHVGWTGPTCGQVLRTTFSLYLHVLNVTFAPALADSSSQEFLALALPFCDEVTSLLQSRPDLFPYFWECKVVSFRDNPVVMHLGLTFNGNESRSTLHGIQDVLLNRKPSLYAGQFGVVLGNLLIEIPYNATAVTWFALLLDLPFTSDLGNSMSSAYRDVDSSLCTDISSLMESQARLAQYYIGCYAGDIVDGTVFIPGSSMVSIVIYLDAALTSGAVPGDLAVFLSDVRPLVRYGDYLGYNLGDYAVYSHHYPGYIDVSLVFDVLNLSWSPDLDDPQSTMYRQLAAAVCTEVTLSLSHNSSLAWGLKDCVDVQTRESPPEVNITLRFDSADMPFDVNSIDFYELIKDTTPENVYYNYYSHTLGPLLVYHHTWGTFAYDAVLLDTTFVMHSPTYTAELDDKNSTAFRDLQTSFCEDIDTFMAASDLNQRYYGCSITTIGDTPPHTLTIRAVFNGTGDITQQNFIVAINNMAPSGTIGGIQLWDVGTATVSLSTHATGQPVNMSDYTTPLPPVDIVSTKFTITFIPLNLTYVAALSDRSSVEFTALADLIETELDALFLNKHRMEDFLASTVLEFRETPPEIKVEMLFEGRQLSTKESQIVQVIQENARRVSYNIGTALIIGSVLFDPDNVVITRSESTDPTTTAATTTMSSTTTTTTTAPPTTTTPTTTTTTPVTTTSVTTTTPTTTTPTTTTTTPTTTTTTPTTTTPTTTTPTTTTTTPTTTTPTTTTPTTTTPTTTTTTPTTTTTTPTTTTPTTTTPTTTMTTPTTTATTPTTTRLTTTEAGPQQGVCDGVISSGEEYRPDPTTCRYFYLCFESFALGMFCPVGEGYNADLQRCDTNITCV